MKLQNCFIQTHTTITAPLIHTQAGEDWVLALQRKDIPVSLYRLYGQSNYLSLNEVPQFFADDQHLLWGYYGMLLRSLKGLFVEAEEEAVQLTQWMEQEYDPFKEQRGEKWVENAANKTQRFIKYLTVTLAAILDALADLIALFFTHKISGLKVGKSKFQDVFNWIKKPSQALSSIASPPDFFLGEIYSALRPLLLSSGSDQEWYPYLMMLRNKSAHMGDSMFPIFSYHDQNHVFYKYLPRKWPLTVAGYVLPNDSTSAGRPDPKEFLIHQDVNSYFEGLRTKISAVVDQSLEVLSKNYPLICSFPFNQAAFDELSQNKVAYKFEYFPPEV